MNLTFSTRARLVAAFCWILPTTVYSQTSTPGTPSITMQGQAEDTGSPVIRNALGRPCLDVEAAARAHVVNPNMVDHLVSLKNNCPRLIKVKVCYFNSDRCNNIDIPPYKRADTVLGTTQIKFFRYSIFQK